MVVDFDKLILWQLHTQTHTQLLYITYHTIVFQNLEDSIEMTKIKIVRAEKLISGLGGEKNRWTQNVADLSATYDNIVGDVLLSASYVAYLGPFIMDLRQVSLVWTMRICCIISGRQTGWNINENILMNLS